MKSTVCILAGVSALLFCCTARAQIGDSTLLEETQSLYAAGDSAGGESALHARLRRAGDLRRSEPGQAMAIAREALRQCEERGDSLGASDAANSIAVTCAMMGQWEMALEYSFRAARWKEYGRDRSGVAAVYSNIGIILGKLHDDERALQYHLKALKYYEALHDRQGRACSYNNLGILCMNQGAHARALEFYRKSLALKEQIRDARGIAATQLNIGVTYRNSGDTARALAYCLRAAEAFRALGDEHGLAESYNKLGTLHLAMGRYADALDDARAAIPLAEHVHARLVLRGLYKLCSDALAGLGRHAEALRNFQRYSALKDSLFNEESARRMLLTLARFEADRRDRDIELLVKDQNLRQTELSRQRAELDAQGSRIRLLTQDRTIRELEMVRQQGVTREQRYRAEASEHDVLLLQRANELVVKDRALKESRLKRQTQLGSSLFGGTLFLAVIIVLLANRYRIKKQSEQLARRKNVELQSANEEIRSHEAQLRLQSVAIEHANEQLQLRNADLERLNREKNEFLGIAAHDLKNPLVMIRSLAEIMTMPGQPAVNARDCVEYISQGADHMISLVSNLLDINAIESGCFPIHCTETNLLPLAERVASDYRLRMEAKDIALLLDTASPCGNAFVDEAACGQIFDNLVSNAVKYSPSGTRVIMRLSDVTEGVLFEVEDEGPGISQADQERLFLRFSRLSARPTGDEYATGLGLSIVKRLTEAMGGTVTCVSAEGRGSRFSVLFPHAAMAPQAMTPPSTMAHAKKPDPRSAASIVECEL